MRREVMKKYSKVEVIWTDSTSGKIEWEYLSDLDKLPTSKCRTIGYVLEDNKKYITLGFSMGGKQVCGRMTIPRHAIITVRKLRNEIT